MEVARVLQSYLDREIDDVTAQRVARHLEVCRRCGLAAATYEAIKQSLVRRAGPPDRGAVERLQAFSEQLAEPGPPEGRTGDPGA
jgi:anti-sigma factor RsiW